MRTMFDSQGSHSAVHRAVGAAALLLLCALTAATPGFAEGSREHVRAGTISVTGTGTVSARPDIAVVRLGVETRSADVATALEEAASRVRAVEKALLADGVAADDITTVDYHVGFVPSSPQRPGSGPASASEASAGFYRVSDVAAITVRQIGLLGKILDDALSAGGNEVQGVSFRIADRAPLERQARAMAFRRAHAEAGQIAALAGEKLGPVLRVTTGGSAAPEGGFRAAAFAAAPGVSPGSLEVSITLNVVYEIGGR